MLENKDINIFQYGGCGAIYFYHQLCLTGDFSMRFRFNKSIDYVRNRGFRKKRNQSWKKDEVQCDNIATKKLDTNLRKIYCTVNSYNQWENFEGRKVFLYTNLQTQIRMNWFKKSFWFYHITGHDWEIPQTYTGIKTLIKSNPNNIFNHIVNNGILSRPDVYAIKFDDIVTVDGLSKVFNDLGTKINQQNIDFMKHYIECHPDKLLKKCGIKKLLDK